jgi:hypothetical protein
MLRVALLITAVVIAGAAPGSASGGMIDLRITFQADTSTAPRFFTLRCGERATGTVPQPAAACSRLRALGERAFRPTPPDMGCADIWGGPSQARVAGTFLGRRLWVRLRLVNACEIARWHRVGFLLPRPASGAS